jgi:hypothetical protein
MAELGIFDISAERFTSHALLDYSAGRLWFLFPFVFDYLRARVISRWLYSKTNTSCAEKALRACAGQPGSLLDGAAQLSLSTANESWITAAQRRNGGFEFDRLALCGFFHFTVALAKSSNLGGRREVTSALSIVFGKGEGSCLKELYITGGVSNLDLRDLSFRSCEFAVSNLQNVLLTKTRILLSARLQEGSLRMDVLTLELSMLMQTACFPHMHVRHSSPHVCVE